MIIPELDTLTDELAKLPTVGVKTARRLAFAIIFGSKEYAKDLSAAVINAREVIRACKVCHGVSTSEICEICSDETRDNETLCVVAMPKDVLAIEDSNAYNGKYHVLNGIISPMDGVGPADLTFESLEKRVKEGNFKEVILAMNPTIEGEATAHYITKLIYKNEIKISRIASGIPKGMELEYASDFTIQGAFDSRGTFLNY